MVGKQNDTSTSQSGKKEDANEKRKAQDKDAREKKIAKVRALAAEGLTASAMAVKMLVSRNVIIGLCHRNGIVLQSNHPFHRLDQKKAPPKKAPFLSTKRVFQNKKPCHTRRPKAALKIPDLPSDHKALYTGRRSKKLVGYEAHKGVKLLALGRGMCKWPLGELFDKAVDFCGKESGENVYCETHMQVKKYGSHSLHG